MFYIFLEEMVRLQISGTVIFAVLLLFLVSNKEVLGINRRKSYRQER